MIGVVGNICIESAAVGLRNLGIEVYIFENGTMWMDLEKGIFCEGPDNKEKSMIRLKNIGCSFTQCNF
jgi:hypothetical protein